MIENENGLCYAKDRMLRKTDSEIAGKNDGDLRDKQNVSMRRLYTKQAFEKIHDLLEYLEKEQDVLTQENENLGKQINRLPRREDYQPLEYGIEQILQICQSDSKRAEEELRQYKDKLRQCQDQLESEIENRKKVEENLNKERQEWNKKEEESERQKSELDKENRTIRALNEQYIEKMQKMPALMELYDAYDAIMKKKDELPQKFFERIQTAMPMDDFDRFLPAALKRSFPIAFYLSIQSFISACSYNRQISDGTMKEALRISDQLLEKVFSYGSKYFEEEKLFKIGIERGDDFEEGQCTYIDDKGGMSGDVAHVWFHGFRDEKEKHTYSSYVEGE